MATKPFVQRRTVRYFLALVWSLSSLSCATPKGEVGFSYYLQAAGGQISIFNRARPLSETLRSPYLTLHQKRLLSEVSKIKIFAESYGIKPTKSYDTFVKWDYPAVSYVVTASKPTKFEAKKWSFPFVGSFEYLGWFDPERAKKFALELDELGWDTDVRGASAYSTVGYFDDPILSTMLWEDEDAMGGMVNTILHESMHATVYINDQTSFNESLASFVADRLTPLYLEQQFGLNSIELKSYIQTQRKYDDRMKLYSSYYQRLDQVYRSTISEEEKLKKKADIIDALKSTIKSEKKINNASLYQYKIYHRAGSEFDQMYEILGKDLKKSIACLKQADQKQFKELQQNDFGQVVVTLAKACLGERLQK